MNKGLKILALLATALFVVAAALQYNDPDSLQWIAIYGVAALVSLRVYFGKIAPLLVTVVSAVYLIWGIVSWPEEFVGLSLESGDINSVEQGREALGLIVTGIVLGIFSFALRSRKN